MITVPGKILRKEKKKGHLKKPCVFQEVSQPSSHWYLLPMSGGEGVFLPLLLHEVRLALRRVRVRSCVATCPRYPGHRPGNSAAGQVTRHPPSRATVGTHAGISKHSSSWVGRTSRAWLVNIIREITGEHPPPPNSSLGLPPKALDLLFISPALTADFQGKTKKKHPRSGNSFQQASPVKPAPGGVVSALPRTEHGEEMSLLALVGLKVAPRTLPPAAP